MSLIHVKEKMEWADRLSTADLLPRRLPAQTSQRASRHRIR
jgi:hypothetical protein